jgi:hypothetical protein
VNLKPPADGFVFELLKEVPPATPPATVYTFFSKTFARLLSLESSVPRLRKRQPTLAPSSLIPILFQDACELQGTKVCTAPSATDAAPAFSTPHTQLGPLQAALLSTAILRGESLTVAAWVLNCAVSENVKICQDCIGVLSSALSFIKDPSVHERFWRACLLLPGQRHASDLKEKEEFPAAGAPEDM